MGGKGGRSGLLSHIPKTMRHATRAPNELHAAWAMSAADHTNIFMLRERERQGALIGMPCVPHPLRDREALECEVLGVLRRESWLAIVVF